MMQIEATPEEWAVVLQLLDHGTRHIGAALSQVGLSASLECGQALIVSGTMGRRIEQCMAVESEKAKHAAWAASEVAKPAAAKPGSMSADRREQIAARQVA